ncbi:hypothetical protein [Enterococcus villorum]|uniref:Uncharacterized protein n=2 Tax=Enterococcus villorum TaxID=112904 RepID=A0A511IZ33_9ENTE|nr:hypothetical protein [Enterococcus villorum]EOH87438.1 hypothetical protein UAO_02149 [Enterococcus villorum ATCC 700913]EOW77843.1 hypothetical protein I591_00697 [Enterococcus villorum ATCC 700913]GEL91017.1 hypothetical protein EVI01_03540 [Enterococcus villorum]
MKLDQIVTMALQTANILNGTLHSENQNQGKELGEISDLENSFEISFLSDETHLREKRHTKHRNEMDSQQSSKMADSYHRHPYSAHSPKEKLPIPYKKDFKQSQIEQQKIKELIKNKRTEFYELKKESHSKSFTLRHTQKFYKEFHDLKDRLLINQTMMIDQQRTINIFLEYGKIVDKENALKYVKKYDFKINKSKIDEETINNLISDCEEMIKELQKSIKSKAKETRLGNTSTTTTTAKPIISREGGQILISALDLSKQYTDLTHEINKLSEKAKKLVIQLFENKQSPQAKPLHNINNIKTDIENINKNLIPKLEKERNLVKDKITDEKKNIESLVKEGKINSDKAAEFIKMYDDLISNSDGPIYSFSLEESTKPKGIHVESTPKTTIPPLSELEGYTVLRFSDLSEKYNDLTQKINDLCSQINNLDSRLHTYKNLTPYDIQEIKVAINTMENEKLPKLKFDRKEIESEIIHERKCLEEHVKNRKLSPSFAKEYINEYDKLIHQFEKPSKEFDIDSRRMNQLFPNFTPTTAVNNTFTTESPTIFTSETYIQRRNKMLESDLSRVMKEIKYLRDTVDWATSSNLKFNLLERKQNPGGYTPIYSDEYLNEKLDDVRNNQLPKVEYERDLVQSQIINEKDYISSLIKEGKINFSVAAECMNKYEKLLNQLEKPIHDFNIDNARERIDSLVKQSLSKYTSAIAENNKTTIERPPISTPETYIQIRNKMIEKNFYEVKKRTTEIYRHLTDIEFALYAEKQNPKIDNRIEDLIARRDEIKNNQLPKLDYERGLIQDQIINEKHYINSLIKAGKMSAVEAKEFISKYNELITINKFEPPIPDINLDNAKERIDSLVKQSYLTKYAPTTERPTPTIDVSTTARPTISPQELDIQKRIMERVSRYEAMRISVSGIRGQAKYAKDMILAKKKNPDDDRIPGIEESREQLEFLNARLLSLENERTGIQSVLMNEKNSIEPLVKKGKMSAVKATEYINLYNELIDRLKEPIPDINMINHTITTERIATTTPASPTIFTSESEARKRIKEVESSFNDVIGAITSLRSQVHDIEELLLEKKKNPEYNLLSIEKLREERENIRAGLLPIEKQRTFIQSALMDEKKSIEALVKSGKMSAVEAREYINKYNELIDKSKQPLYGVNMDNNTSTTKRAMTTTTEIPTTPTISTPETYIQRRNKILELKLDMVIQEITYLNNKTNDIDDMLFFKEQVPELSLPNSIEVLRAQRDEIRYDLLPSLEYRRDFVQSQIMNEKNAIESLLKTGKMSAVEAEKYRSEYNKLMDKFELPRYYIDIESDNKRKKRDLSLEQSFSEKLANTATDNKEKQRLSKKLESIATNNKQNVLRNRSARKRKSVIAR